LVNIYLSWTLALNGEGKWNNGDVRRIPVRGVRRSSTKI
jgi:hypothetical protein